jgi:hypothetical protein
MRRGHVGAPLDLQVCAPDRYAYAANQPPEASVDHLVVVTYPQPLVIEVRALERDAGDDGNVGMAYYYDDHVIARGVVDPEVVPSIRSLLEKPVMVALAATEDESGNIEARVCLVLPVEHGRAEEEDEEDAPWKASIPAPPPEAEPGYAAEEEGEDDEEDRKRKLALLPIGNVVRNAPDRHHLDNVAADVSEMLRNLLAGRARDAVQKAIDDLLDSIG